MKVQATFLREVGKTKDNPPKPIYKWAESGDQELNFGRVMRVTIYHMDKRVEMEFCPLQDSAKCPRMEATINDIAQPQQPSGSPGFTAEIKLFNPDSAVKTLLAEHQNFLLDYTQGQYNNTQFLKGEKKDLERYYDGRARAKIECGYWVVDENEKDDAGNIVGGHPDYHLLFDGFINSSLEYLQGNDIILHLYCHDFDSGQISNKAVLDSIGIQYTPEDLIKWQELSQEEQSRRSGKNEPSWHTLAGKLCRNFLPTRKVLYKQDDGQIFYSTRPTNVTDRASNDWFSIRYINTPQKKDEVNIQLENYLTSSLVNVNNFTTNSSNFYGIFNELCSYGGVNVGYMVDLEYDPQKVIVWVYPVGSGYKPFDPDKEKKPCIKIINYQNLISVPMAGADGSLTIKMFLNWDARPLNGIELVLDERYGADSTTSDEFYVVKAAASGYNNGTVRGGIREVIVNGGKISPYMTTIQGARSSGVYSLQYGTEFANEHGYLFNIGFPIIRTKHEVSTHGKAWYTTVITVPKFTGLKL